MAKPLFAPKTQIQPKEDHWIPLSDLMSGLMMVFVLVAIVFMVKVQNEAAKAEEQARHAEEQAIRVRDIAMLYDAMRNQLYEDLRREFSSDLPRWGAELTNDLAIRFKEPDVLFDVGKATLKVRFTQILDEFFPRYVRILASTKYKETIEEIRIEGHTSRIWGNVTDESLSYFKNMELSQARTRSTLEYVLMHPDLFGYRRWLRVYVTANGLSFSKPRLNADGSENRDGSQRVEFRVRTNADSRIEEILRTANK